MHGILSLATFFIKIVDKTETIQAIFIDIKKYRFFSLYFCINTREILTLWMLPINISPQDVHRLCCFLCLRRIAETFMFALAYYITPVYNRMSIQNKWSKMGEGIISGWGWEVVFLQIKLFVKLSTLKEKCILLLC